MGALRKNRLRRCIDCGVVPNLRARDHGSAAKTGPVARKYGGHLPAAELHTVIAHEFAHIHRKDFLKNLLYQLLSLPVSYHPLLWLTRARIMESREMVCDQMAAAMTGRDEYAQSLLRLASLLVTGQLHTTPHAIGIFDANVFERRLMNLTENPKNIQGAARVAAMAACAALGLATCGTALALGMHGNAASPSESSNAIKNAQAAVSSLCSDGRKSTHQDHADISSRGQEG